MQLRPQSIQRARRSGGALLLLLGAACAAPPKAAPPPPFTLAADNFAGSVRSGPVADAPGLSGLDRDPWSVDLWLARVDAWAGDDGLPLASLVRQVLVEQSGEPLRTRGELALGVRVAPSAGALPAASWERREVALLWPGTTASWTAALHPEALDPARTRWEAFGVQVARPIDASARCELALSFEGLVTPAAEVADGAEEGERARAPEPVRQRERLVLDLTQLPPDEPLRFLLPAPRVNLPRAVVLVELSVSRAPDLGRAELQAALERDRERLAASLARARSGAALPDSESAFRLERSSALAALERLRPHRSALLFLADATGAELAAELALLADDATLAEFQDELSQALARAPVALESAAACGWFLEQATYRWLARRAVDPARALPPELRSLLVRTTGELGRYPDLVLEVLAECGDAAEVHRRLLAENRIFLEDGHPAARVRAFDWLRVRGAAPAGYDPLGAREARRAALAALEEQGP